MEDIKCKAILKSGPNEGQRCKCKIKQNGYCGRHKSYVSSTSTKSTTKTTIVKQVEKLHEEENYKWMELPEGDSRVDIYDIIPENIQVSNTLFKELWNLHPKERSTIKIFGKVMKVPRYQESYGQDYFYSGKNHKAREITHPYLKKLMKWICKDSGKKYQQLLINWYENGQHYIGAHSDDEKQLVKNSAIYSFSFGNARDFVIQSRKGISVYRKVIQMENNTLLIMKGEMQSYYKHSVPKRANTKRRINITFRLFK